MANNHRVVVNPGSLPFASYPVALSTTVPFNVDYSQQKIADMFEVQQACISVIVTNKCWKHLLEAN